MAMLLLLAVSLLDLTTGVTTGPSGALNLWRTGRLTQWSRVLDRRFDREYRAFGKVRPDLRYRTQILVVDGEGVRARICEAVLDRLCEDVDADVDAASSSMTLSHESRRPTTALSDTLSAVGLSPLSLKAGARNLQPNDLLLGSRWDLIVCTDLNVLERVRALTRAANAIDRAGGLPEKGDGVHEADALRHGLGTGPPLRRRHQIPARRPGRADVPKGEAEA